MSRTLLHFRSKALFQKLTSATTLILASSSIQACSGFPIFHNIQNQVSNMSTSTCAPSSTAKYSTNLEVVQFQCLDDNYGYLIHDSETGDTAAIDTPDADTYQKQLDDRGWNLSHIFWCVRDVDIDDYPNTNS